MLSLLLLRLHFRSDTPVRQPIGGDVWRSAFGLHLRRRTCLTGAAACDGCRAHARCAFTSIIQTHAGRDGALLEAKTDAPKPYILSPQPISGADSTRVELDLTLFGSAIAQAPVVLASLVAAAAAGLGSGRTVLRFGRVERIDSYGRAGAWAPDAPTSVMPDEGYAPPPVPRAANIVLLSPLRLRIGGRDLHPGALTFPVFLKAILRRHSMLTECFGDAVDALPAAAVRELVRAAQGIAMTEARLRWRDQWRWSSRQHRRMPTGGILGSFSLQGDLAPVWPWLWQGQWLHAGKGAVMGLGRFRVEARREPVTWLVSRHPGAHEFAQRIGQAFDRCVEHLDTSLVCAGDTVIGNLPVNLAAEVCRSGARYLHLSAPMDVAQRGRELSADELQRLQAQIEEFRIEPRKSPSR